MLVADPCADTVESTAWLLDLWGYEVLSAARGPEVLDAARAPHPDVVLMEIGLPGLDGCEVARRLRAGGSGGPLLVAVTGRGSDGDRRRSREAGFDGHLVKPVEPELLHDLLPGSRQEAGQEECARR